MSDRFQQEKGETYYRRCINGHVRRGKKTVNSGMNKHKACKMMSDARQKQSSFYRYLQKLTDTSDSSRVTMGYNMGGQPV